MTGSIHKATYSYIGTHFTQEKHQTEYLQLYMQISAFVLQNYDVF